MMRPIVLLIMLSSTAAAQQLAPAPVDLTYRFHSGQKLHYQKKLEIRNPDNLPGGWPSSDETTETFITVERVNDDGTATLIVRNYESTDNDDENTSGSGGKVTVVRGHDIPIYALTVDRYGNILHGTIIKRSLDDSEFVEKMKDPGFVGHRLPDSSLIKLHAKDLIPARPQMKNPIPGAKLHDSIYKVGKVEHYDFAGKTATGTPKPEPPPQPTYDLDLKDYSIVQGKDERMDSEYRIISNGGHDQVWNGKLVGHNILTADEHVRNSDGLPTKWTEMSRRVKNGIPETSYMKRTLTLISSD